MRKQRTILIMCGLLIGVPAIAMYSSLRNRLATNWIALKNAATNAWSSTVKSYTPKISSPASWPPNLFSRSYSIPRFPSPHTATNKPITPRWPGSPFTHNLDTRTFATSSPLGIPFWQKFFGFTKSPQSAQPAIGEHTSWDTTVIKTEAHNMFEQIKRPQSATDLQKTLSDMHQALAQHPAIDVIYIRDEIQKLAENDSTFAQHIVDNIIKSADAPYLKIYHALQVINPFTHFYKGQGLFPKSVEKEIGAQLIRFINDRSKITTMDLATLSLKIPTHRHLLKAVQHKLLLLPTHVYDLLMLIEAATLYANNQPSETPYDVITQHMSQETINAIQHVQYAYTEAEIAIAALTAVRKILEEHKISEPEIKRFINNQ